MERTRKCEQASVHGQSLQQVELRFKRWRENRRRGEHIPPALWAAAVGLAKGHGLDRVAHQLRVDHDGLKKRLERSAGVAEHAHAARRSTALAPRFVELFSPAVPAVTGLRECVVEMENARGSKMRVALNGNGLAGLAGLCNAFWGG